MKPKIDKEQLKKEIEKKEKLFKNKKLIKK